MYHKQVLDDELHGNEMYKDVYFYDKSSQTVGLESNLIDFSENIKKHAS